MHSFLEFLEDDLDEAVKRKIVIRKGKRKIKYVSDKAGYKVINKREVKINPGDMRKMSIRNTRSARKRKGKINVANLRRRRSLQRRTGLWN